MNVANEEKVKKTYPGKKNKKTVPSCIMCKTVFQENDFFLQCSQCLKDGNTRDICPECHPKDSPHNKIHVNFISGKRYRTC